MDPDDKNEGGVELQEVKKVDQTVNSQNNLIENKDGTKSIKLPIEVDPIDLQDAQEAHDKLK